MDIDEMNGHRWSSVNAYYEGTILDDFLMTEYGLDPLDPLDALDELEDIDGVDNEDFPDEPGEGPDEL